MPCSPEGVRPISTHVFLWTAITVALSVQGCLVADEALAIDGACGGCLNDRDCAAGATCVIDDGGCGQCVGLICLVDADCQDGEACDPGRGRCEVPILCDAAGPDLGCGPAEQCLVLDVQGCRAPPVGDTCALWPPSRTVASGPLVVAAVGRAADGRLVPTGRAEFQASVAGTGVPVEARSHDRVVVDATCARPGRCVVEVAAVVGAARCQARYVVVPPGADDDVHVIVADEDLGGRIAGAAITVVAEGSVVTGVTDDDGVFLAPGIGRNVERVTVVAAGFDGWSCLGCGSTLDVALPRRIESTAVPAIAGAVDLASPVGDVILGLAGLPLTTPSFEAGALFGASGSIPFTLDGVTPDGSRTAFASAGTMRLGTTVIREGFVAFGRPSGRALWAFGARTSLSSVGPLVARRELPRDLRLEVLRIASPVAASGLLGTVVTMPIALPPSSPGLPAALENLRGPGDARVLADVDVAADVDVTIPGPLPAGTSDVVIIVGAILPGEGLIPLGGAVLSTTTGDGTRGVVPATTRIPFAPPHDGLEGRALRLIAIAVDVDDMIARDALGHARTLVELPAPAPGRVLAVTLPPFATAPRASIVSDVLVINDAGDLPGLRLRVPLPGGGAHIVDLTAPGVSGLPLGLGDVLDDLTVLVDDDGFSVDAIDLAAIEVGSRDHTLPSADPWDQPGRSARR